MILFFMHLKLSNVSVLNLDVCYLNSIFNYFDTKIIKYIYQFLL